MVDCKPYLQSICPTYDHWWEAHTITDVVRKNHDKQVGKSLLFDLQAITVKPEALKPEREQFPEAREEREILNVLEGLRKYAAEHVLLIGRPGSGKSTALKRLLLEEAQVFEDKGDLEDKEDRGEKGDKGNETVIARNEAISTIGENPQIPVLGWMMRVWRCVLSGWLCRLIGS